MGAKQGTGRKQDFPTKLDLKDSIDGLREDLRKDYSALQTSVDAYARKTDTYHQELAAVKSTLER